MSYTAESTTYAPCPPAPSVPGWSSEMRYAGRRHGVGFGIILIMLGCIFLAAQFVPGLAWWTLWPVIFVVGGLVQAITADYHGYYSVHRFMDGAGSIVFGLVLLANTTGLVPWAMWWTVLALWPVLLIGLGLSVLGKGLGQEWLRVLAPVAIWLALAYAVAASLGIAGFVSFAPQQWAQPAVNSVSDAVRNAIAGSEFSAVVR